jgi:DNA-directed RNA polymerase subunit RPC12/RpoP
VSVECLNCGNKYKIKDAYKNAKKNPTKGWSCSTCGGALEVPEKYKTSFIECEYCGRVHIKDLIKNAKCPNCGGTVKDFR